MREYLNYCGCSSPYFFDIETFTPFMAHTVLKKYFGGIGAPKNIRNRIVQERNRLIGTYGDLDTDGCEEHIFIPIDFLAVPYLRIDKELLPRINLPRKTPDDYMDCLCWNGKHLSCLFDTQVIYDNDVFPKKANLTLSVALTEINVTMFFTEIELSPLNSLNPLAVPDELIKSIVNKVWT